ncbi:MAG TPA: alcohol dehydrogenase catalytic domain-containing protein, partial [Thermodesulfobacteriota bacterium]|nr:alcohol dehydrogenase catalytic domain-containing protein [Thermodesulfobacteriota bacterium]
MHAMVLEAPEKALRAMEVSVPRPGPQQVLIKVNACGVCRTDLHIVDGELPNPKFPLIPGHEIVGTVMKTGDQAEKFFVGDRVGVPWLGYTCSECRYCKREQENLCDRALFTGYTIDGGYAEYTVADQRYCFRIPDYYTEINAAPLLCAGIIGY